MAEAGQADVPIPSAQAALPTLQRTDRFDTCRLLDPFGRLAPADAETNHRFTLEARETTA